MHAQHCPHGPLRRSAHAAASLTGTILDGVYICPNLNPSANMRVIIGNGMLTSAVKSNRLESLAEIQL